MTPLISYHRTLLQEEYTAKTTASPAPPFTSNSPFDSSLALTILILLTVLFFMAFFSLYIRRFSTIMNSEDSSVSGHDRPPLRLRIRKHGGGYDTSTVRSLPVVPYGGESKICSDCSICLSEFEEREMVKLIPYCRHAFHPTCIDTWLSSNVSCPLCRSTQLFLSTG